MPPQLLGLGLLFLVHLLLAAPATADDFGPLNKLLAHVRFTVPPGLIPPVKTTGVTITFKELYCEGINIGGMSLEDDVGPNAAAVGKTATVSVALWNTGITCHINCHVAAPLGIASDVTAEATIAGTSAEAAIRFTAAGTGSLADSPPATCHTDSCNLDLKVKDLTVDASGLGKLGEWVVDLFKSTVKSTIEKEVDPIACEQLRAQVDPVTGGLPKLLQNLTRLVGPYLAAGSSYEPEGAARPAEYEAAALQEISSSSSSPSPSPSPDRPFLAFAPSKVTVVLADVINGVLGKPLKRAIAAAGTAAPREDPQLPINRMLKAVVDELAATGVGTHGNGSGTLTIPLNATLYSGTDMLTRTNLTLANVTLYGLDTVRTFSVLEPVSRTNMTLKHELAVDELSALLHMEADMDAGGSVQSGDGEIYVPFKVRLSLKDLAVNASTVLAIDPYALPTENFTLGSLMAPGGALNCLVLPAVAGFNATAMTASLGDVTASIEDFIDPTLDRLLDNVTQIALALMEGTVRTAMPAGLDGLGRPLINTLVAEAMADAKAKAGTCHDPKRAPAAPGAIVDFSSSSALQVVDWLVNGVMLPELTATSRVGVTTPPGSSSSTEGGPLPEAIVVVEDLNSLSINRWIATALDAIFSSSSSSSATTSSTALDASADGRFMVPPLAGGPWTGPSGGIGDLGKVIPGPTVADASAGDAVLVDLGFDLGSFGKIKARVANLTVFGLAAAGNVSILTTPPATHPATHPAAAAATDRAHTLRSYMELGMPSPPRALGMSVAIDLDYDGVTPDPHTGKPSTVADSFVMSVGAGGMRLGGDLLLEINNETLRGVDFSPLVKLLLGGGDGGDETMSSSGGSSGSGGSGSGSSSSSSTSSPPTLSGALLALAASLAKAIEKLRLPAMDMGLAGIPMHVRCRPGSPAAAAGCSSSGLVGLDTKMNSAAGSAQAARAGNYVLGLVGEYLTSAKVEAMIDPALKSFVDKYDPAVQPPPGPPAPPGGNTGGGGSADGGNGALHALGGPGGVAAIASGAVLLLAALITILCRKRLHVLCPGCCGCRSCGSKAAGGYDAAGGSAADGAGDTGETKSSGGGAAGARAGGGGRAPPATGGNCDEALLFHPCIPRAPRYLIPVMLLTNFILFLSAHTNTGATVDVDVGLAGSSIPIDNLFAFTLSNSIHDMWTAKVYPLALLIAVFSGAWPYIKILLIFLCWVAPPRLLTVRRRGQFLQVLDIMGKWSLIDAYVLVMMMVAFNLHIATPSGLDAVPDAFLDVTVSVNPHWGFYGFLLAAVWALAVNHAAIAYHRDAVSAESQVRRRTLSRPLLSSSIGSSFDGSGSGSGRASGGGASGGGASGGGASGGGASGGGASGGAASAAQAAAAFEASQAAAEKAAGLEAGDGGGGGGGGGGIAAGADEDIMGAPSPWSFAAGGGGAGANAQRQKRSRSWFDAPVTMAEDSLEEGQSLSQADQAVDRLHKILIGKREALVRHMYENHGHSYRFMLGPVGQVLTIATTIFSLVTMVWGSYEDSFSFHFHGLVAVGLEMTKNGSSNADYSLISTATTMDPSNGVWIIQATFLMFALVIPVIQIAMLMALWAIPLTLREQKFMFFVNEILSAWSSLEVFIISIVAALLEIGQFAGFMVGDKCDLINEVMNATLANTGWIPASEANCFSVDATLKHGCWMLFTGAVTANIICQVVNRTCEAAIEDREDRIKQVEPGYVPEPKEMPDPRCLESTRRCAVCCSKCYVVRVLPKNRTAGGSVNDRNAAGEPRTSAASSSGGNLAYNVR